MEPMVKKVKQKLKSTKKKNEEKRVMENGSILLKELIADCNGESIPIRSFSASHIRKATNNFAYSCLVKSQWDDKWYKGIIDDKPYLIRRFFFVKRVKGVYNDIVLSARMSNHSNFLKLVGCCFEFSFPVIVFEYAEHRALNEEGRIVVIGEESITLPWSLRLKIAKEIAVAVTYLHTAFPKIIIHRDIKLANVFLDKNMTAKLCDFSISITLPEGRSRINVDHVQGTYRYLDPLYMRMGLVSEYMDVYSFGMCLLVFLSGRSDVAFYVESNPDEDPYLKGLYESGKLEEVIDPTMAKDITSGQRLEVEACVVLALRCCEEREEDRPKMIQVAKELKRIERVEQSIDATEIIEQPVDATEITEQSVDATEIIEQSLDDIELKEQSVGATSGLLKPEMVEDGSSTVEWTRRFGFKIEIMLMLCLCIIGFLMALFFR